MHPSFASITLPFDIQFHIRMYLTFKFHIYYVPKRAQTLSSGDISAKAQSVLTMTKVSLFMSINYKKQNREE